MGRIASAKALDGAGTFSWLYDEQSDWILATLPVDAVPRSGIWELEALMAVRKK